VARGAKQESGRDRSKSSAKVSMLGIQREAGSAGYCARMLIFNISNRLANWAGTHFYSIQGISMAGKLRRVFEGAHPRMPKRVLIADDNDITRRMIRAYIEKQTAVEVCAETVDGRETVDTALALRPDLLILDVLMPGFNGMEVAWILKKGLPEAKTILFTMYGDFFGSNIALAAGVNLILPKPEGLSSLAQAVNSLLEHPSGGPQVGVSLAATKDGDTPPSQKATAEEDTALEKALRESEERFQATFEQTGVGMGHVAEDGRWLRVNQRLCDLLGYTKEEVLTHKFQDIVYPEDLAIELRQARRIVAGELDHYSIGSRYVRKDGQILSVHMTVDAVRDGAGNLKYCVRVAEELRGGREAWAGAHTATC
jgi:PAS domain S-box-containing protein